MPADASSYTHTDYTHFTSYAVPKQLTSRLFLRIDDYFEEEKTQNILIV